GRVRLRPGLDWWSFATLFPWCYRGHDQQPTSPENAMPMQVLEPMPPPQEVDSRFTELVNELGLSEQKKAAMFALPTKKKWEIYCFNKNVSDFIGNPMQLKSVQHFPALN
uniref:Formin GTPase-binding domain-containing protein n=1 Tax=Poecilia reticulata TaxID=8081 RepID=A0A3P9P9A9_POERE